MANYKIAELKKEINKIKTRGAWTKGVKQYALELLDDYEDGFGTDNLSDTKKLLNGASNWKQASYGGSHLIYDGDIAERLSSPSELKMTRNGERNPNARETWLDVQARALQQAEWMIQDAMKNIDKAVNVPKASKTKLPSNAQLSNRAFK